MQCPSQSQQNSSQTSKEGYSTSYGKSKKPRIAKTILYNKRISRGITIPEFKLYYRATVLTPVWYFHKNRQEDQWNLIEDPDINPHLMNTSFLTKKQKKVKWKKESIFNKWCWHNWVSTCRKMKIDPYLEQNSSPYGSKTST